MRMAACCGTTCLLCCDVFVDKCDIKKFRRKKKPHFLKVFQITLWSNHMLKNFLSWKQSPDDLQALKLPKTKSSLPQKHSDGCTLVENSFSSYALMLKNALVPCHLLFFCREYKGVVAQQSFWLMGWLCIHSNKLGHTLKLFGYLPNYLQCQPGTTVFLGINYNSI